MKYIFRNQTPEISMEIIFWPIVIKKRHLAISEFSGSQCTFSQELIKKGTQISIKKGTQISIKKGTQISNKKVLKF